MCKPGFLFCLLAMLAALSLSSQADQLTDPTRPLGYDGQSSPTPLALNAILVSGKRKQAVINGQRLEENDTIKHSGGIRVKSIEAHAVLLEQGSKVWRLHLAGDAVRRAPKD